MLQTSSLQPVVCLACWRTAVPVEQSSLTCRHELRAFEASQTILKNMRISTWQLEQIIDIIGQSLKILKTCHKTTWCYTGHHLKGGPPKPPSMKNVQLKIAEEGSRPNGVVRWYWTQKKSSSSRSRCLAAGWNVSETLHPSWRFLLSYQNICSAKVKDNRYRDLSCIAWGPWTLFYREQR